MQNHKERATAEFLGWLAGFVGEKVSPKELEIVVLTAANIFLTNEVLLYNTPRKIVRSNDGGSLRCPNCGLDMMGGPDSEVYNIEPADDLIYNCWECGQKLDWEVD